MKKLLLTLSALLVLTGCSNASVSVTDSSGAVVTIANQSYTRGDLYEFMSSYSGGYLAILNTQQHILDTEVPVTDAMTQVADETIDMYASMFGDGLESYIQSMGVPSVEAYHTELIVGEQLKALNRLYIEANYDELAARYVPKQYQMMQFTDVDTANAALTQLQAGEEFTTVATNNASTTSASPLIATTQSSIDTSILFELESLEVGNYSGVITSADATAFYIVKLIENDTSAIKELFIEDLIAGGSTSLETLLHYVETYGFNIYDINIYNQVEANYPDFLNTAN